MNLASLTSRIAKRLAVIAFGAASLWFAAHYVLPYFDHRVPLLIAIGLTYVAMAYVLLPLLFRLLRLFWKTNHIPLHSVTPDGFASDPVNIAVLGTREQLARVFAAAGWHEADDRSVRSVLRMILSIVLAQPYPNAPFSALYLFGRSQDIGLQKAIDDNPRRRHHVRFWQVVQPSGERFRDHVKFWLKHYGSVQPGLTLWVGAATEDTGVGLIRHNAQFTHAIHHDSNAERDFIIKELQKTGHVQGGRTLNASEPYEIKNRVGTTIIADGDIKLLELR